MKPCFKTFYTLLNVAIPLSILVLYAGLEASVLINAGGVYYKFYGMP